MAKRLVWLAALAVAVYGGEVRFTGDGRLERPADYREWVWLSSGLGMTYGPNANGDPAFDNVFVNPSAYRAFLKTGTWPDGTLLILEIRNSRSQGSINRSGHFQGDVRALEAQVKQNGTWTFYDFPARGGAASAIPRTAGCYSCHATNGATDNTFVQFYPTLLEVAKAKGTLRNTE